MAPNTKRLSINTGNSTRKYLHIFNGIFRLTQMEIRVLAAFIDQHLQIQEAGLDMNAFSTESKKQVADRLGRDDFNTLNTYIKRMSEKQAISKTEQGYQIHPFLIPQGEDEVHFRLT